MYGYKIVIFAYSIYVYDTMLSINVYNVSSYEFLSLLCFGFVIVYSNSNVLVLMFSYFGYIFKSREYKTN